MKLKLKQGKAYICSIIGHLQDGERFIGIVDGDTLKDGTWDFKLDRIGIDFEIEGKASKKILVEIANNASLKFEKMLDKLNACEFANAQQSNQIDRLKEELTYKDNVITYLENKGK